MLRFSSLLVSCLLFLCLLGTLPLMAQSPLHDQLKALDKQRFTAQVGKDSAALRRLLADELIYTHSSGVAETKAEFIANVVNGRWNYQTIDPEPVTVRLFGSTAILTGRARLTMLIDGKLTPLYLAYTDVWHQTGGQRWQLVSWASARIAN